MNVLIKMNYLRCIFVDGVRKQVPKKLVSQKCFSLLFASLLDIKMTWFDQSLCSHSEDLKF